MSKPAVRRDPQYFGDRELVLVYIARRLGEALKLESILTEAGVDYAVAADRYIGGVIIRRERVGAFFYVLPEAEAAACEIMKRHGFQPYSDPFGAS